jgi:hypothetical protein
MESSEEILTELLEIAPFLGRAGISRDSYTVPAGFFEDFSEILMNRIHLETDVFLEPDARQELSGISPLLAGLQTKNPYKLPEGYFESWKATIPQSKSVPTKLVAFGTRSRVIRFAVAACIVAFLGTTVFYLTYHRNITDPLSSLANVSDQDMANFLDSDDIHWTPGITSATEMASVDLNDNDIHDLLTNVPDDELEQYSALLPKEKGTVN